MLSWGPEVWTGVLPSKPQGCSATAMKPGKRAGPLLPASLEWWPPAPHLSISPATSGAGPWLLEQSAPHLPGATGSLICPQLQALVLPLSRLSCLGCHRPPGWPCHPVPIPSAPRPGHTLTLDIIPKCCTLPPCTPTSWASSSLSADPGPSPAHTLPLNHCVHLSPPPGTQCEPSQA